MRIVRDYQFVEPEDRGAVAAIGNFDGVHLGHQAVLDMAGKIAAQAKAPLGVLTFEPHPREYFAPDAPTFRLMNAAAKANRLQKIGVQTLYQLNFNAALSGLSARDFAQRVIAEGLGLNHVLVGSDFCFGKGRAGTAEMLQAFGDEFGFGVTIADLIRDGDTVYSSTAIRDALTDGRPQDATKMLGHYHRIEGEVLHGDARGRDLGYPTANMSLDGLHKPKYGVYAVLVDVLTGPHKGTYHGVSSLGERPTFGVNIPNLETFIFDFSGDLYGAELSIALVDFQRPELTFDDLDALIEQMDADSAQARATLASL
ncbi:MAG: bifunctional riboflavin kinase/FAD synthetase [Pseudomonadota bacterium]